MAEDIRERLHQLPAEAFAGEVIPRERGDFVEFVEGDSHHRLRIQVLRGLALAGMFLCLGGIWLLLVLPGPTLAQWISMALCALLGLWCLATFQRLGSTPPPRLRYFRLHVEKERFIPCEHCGVPRSMDLSDVRAFLYFQDTHRATIWHPAHVHTCEEDPRSSIPETPRHRRHHHPTACFPVKAEWHVEQAYLVTSSDTAYPLFREEPERRTGINVVKTLGELTGRPALYLESKMLSDRLARHAHEGRFSEEVLEHAEEIKGWEK